MLRELDIRSDFIIGVLLCPSSVLLFGKISNLTWWFSLTGGTDKAIVFETISLWGSEIYL